LFTIITRTKMQLSLFESQSRLKEAGKRLIGSWADVLPLDTIEQLASIVDTVIVERTVYKDVKIYPELKDIFKVFRMPLDSVKVVILGQDPYYNGNATGLSFACKNNVSKSLFKIGQGIYYNYPDTKAVFDDSNMGLEYWESQGVFLLNSALTTREGQPESHLALWGFFTDEVIRAISINSPNTVAFMLWGKYAREKKPLINKRHKILEFSHPVSASYANVRWDCPHFKQVNNWLEARNKQPIQWL
jgi:uracil-DNA glycosylase